jgi:DNA invertase Pin-like site-specific DNA recombinase
MRVVGYIRVSSESQAENGVSLDAQRAKIAAWCALHDAQLVGVECDAGISGKRLDNRPGAQRALEMIRTGAATTLVICDLSRLSRSTRELLSVVDRYFRGDARSLVSIKESIDTTTPAGRMIVTVLAALGELEREQVAERTKTALAHVRSTGRKTGGDVPFGYRSEAGQLVHDATEQATIARARDLRASGMSLAAVGETLAIEGHRSRVGRVFGAKQVARMLGPQRAIAA